MKKWTYEIGLETDSPFYEDECWIAPIALWILKQVADDQKLSIARAIRMANDQSNDDGTDTPAKTFMRAYSNEMRLSCDIEIEGDGLNIITGTVSAKGYTLTEGMVAFKEISATLFNDVKAGDNLHQIIDLPPLRGRPVLNTSVDLKEYEPYTIYYKPAENVKWADELPVWE